MADVSTTDPRIAFEPADEGGSTPLDKQNKSALRATWARDSLAIAKLGDDKLVWPAFQNEADKELQW